MASTRVEYAVTRILDAIADGEFVPGSALLPEDELAHWLEVSRPTMREAVKILKERGVLIVVHGRGTFVADPEQWTDLASIIWWTVRTAPPALAGEHLVEVRRMIEVGACGLAAERRTEEDLQRMRELLDTYDAASLDDDIDHAVAADLAFHQAVLKGSHNPFVAAILHPLEEALRSSRQLTTQVPEVRQRAAAHHRRIFAAIESGDAAAAKKAMREHMTQTRNDLQTFAQ
ncbi:DNA-binding transcriptional regulator, FadR family [Bowdeniella nasicola]|uniref:DNA-binding transcriptional regulator, FadR family n=1 Tax=Bowdeniella nasicola TaxID=208480 RepID=A0A1H3XZM4_9ACTO|nr:FadR/GntR family transcriptional regulator [Bowdeniella nasicola]SEA04899.1 DNA-binding transcriptional regulator, FadR family [Bowdeniella nasicola]